MSSKENTFDRENLDQYLRTLGKEYRRLNGKTIPAEIILIGSAAVLANYGFRSMTTDVDAIINTSSSMQDAINIVGDKFNLPNGWLNSDFIKTESYSRKLIEIELNGYQIYGITARSTVNENYIYHKDIQYYDIAADTDNLYKNEKEDDADYER